MGQEVIPLIKTTSNPTSGNTTSNGYPLGQHWFNETSGVEFIHKSDGVWVEVGSGSAYIHPTGDGNLHVPATSTTNSGTVLTAGATAGSLTWETPASPTPANNSITNLKLAQVPTATIKGRASSGTGNVEDLTAAQVIAMLNITPAKELVISKSTFNSIAEPGIYKNNATAKNITGHRLTTNATDFSITVAGTTYTNTATYPIALPANAELIINDVTIQTGYNVGNVILIIE